jgi:predicted RNA-binding Zn ribbon-like protein
LYERSGFNAIPKATNPKAVQEAERKAKIKQAKDQAVGKALSDSGQDVNQAIANVTAKGDYATLELLIAKAKADNKSSTDEANKALSPLKDELVKKVRACNNKATLDKIAKLLA